jgi:hypothetical protein
MGKDSERAAWTTFVRKREAEARAAKKKDARARLSSPSAEDALDDLTGDAQRRGGEVREKR